MCLVLPESIQPRIPSAESMRHQVSWSVELHGQRTYRMEWCTDVRFVVWLHAISELFTAWILTDDIPFAEVYTTAIRFPKAERAMHILIPWLPELPKAYRLISYFPRGQEEMIEYLRRKVEDNTKVLAGKLVEFTC